jgi:hypothetical protein
MDLVERYLVAIGRELPAGQAADVVAELRDVLLSQVEEAEERFGRPLTADEVGLLLTAFGHPLVVAGRYRKVQHLIGPEIFPFWWAGLKASLAIAAGVVVVLLAVQFVTAGDLSVAWRLIPSLWETGLEVFAVVTLVAVAVEQTGARRFLLAWCPRRLPPADVKPRSRFETVVDIGLGVVFILWWTGAIDFHNWVPGDMPSVTMAPVWTTYYWPILGYAVADVAVSLVVLTGWNRTVGMLAAARYVAGAAILLALLQAGRWVVVLPAGRSAEEVANLQSAFDTVGHIAIVSVTAVFALKGAAELWRVVRRADAPGPNICGLNLRL